MHGLVRVLAADYAADGIRVNGVVPLPFPLLSFGVTLMATPDEGFAEWMVSVKVGGGLL